MLAVGLIALALAANAEDLPPGKGKEIVQQQCVSCHVLKVVTGKRATKEQWATYVDQMITRGAQVEDDDIDPLVEYLSRNFGPSAPPAKDAPAKNPPSNDSKDSDSKDNDSKDNAAPHTVHVNTAPAADFTAVLGTSEKESEAIVSYRAQNGNFKDWHDLAKVPGVDAGKIESKKDCLVF